MGETRVDLQHLLEDLADAYPGDLDETILTEIVANSLDSGATSIAFTIDPVASTLTAIDNGSGMRRSDLRRFHDIAATSKSRGDGVRARSLRAHPGMTPRGRRSPPRVTFMSETASLSHGRRITT